MLASAPSLPASSDSNLGFSSRKRNASELGDEDERPRKKSRSLATAPDDNLNGASSMSGSAASSSRPSDEVLDDTLRRGQVYRLMSSLGMVAGPAILALVVCGTPWLNQQYSNAHSAAQLLRSSPDLNDLVTQCMSTETYAPIRKHAAFQVKRTLSQILEDMKQIYLPRLRKLARRDFITAVEPPRDTYLAAADEMVRKMVDEDTISPVLIDECFHPCEDHIVFDGAGSSSTELLVKGMIKRPNLYFTARKSGTLGSGTLLRALHYIRTSGQTPFVHSPSARSCHSEGDRYLILAAVAQLTVLDWLLGCLDGLPQYETLRIWTYLQLCPWAGGTGADDDIFVSVFEKIKDMDDAQTISSHLYALERRRDQRFGFQSLFIVLDNAEQLDHELGSQVVADNSVCDIDNVPRSALFAVMQAWSPSRCLLFPYVRRVIATTRLSLDLVRYSRHVSFTKPSGRAWLLHPSARSFDIEASLRAYVMQNIWPDLSETDLAGRDRSLLRRMWRWLRGRSYYTTIYVEMLKKYGISYANRMLDRLVERLTSGYVPNDGTALAEQEPPLEADAEAFLEAVPPLPCCQLPDDETLESHLRLALTNFLVLGNSYELPGTYHRAVTMGFARLLDKTRGYGIVTDDICDPVDLTCVSLGINEPLVFASLLQVYRARGLRLPKMGTAVNVPELKLERSYAKDVATLLFASLVDGTKSLKELSMVSSNSRRKAIFCRPLTLVSITGRNEDGSFVTEDYQPKRESTPTLALRAKGSDDIKRWCHGTGSPFLLPGEEMVSDLVFLARADQQLLWVVFQLDDRVTCSSDSAVDNKSVSQDVIPDIHTIEKASGTNNNEIPVVQLVAPSTSESYADARGEKRAASHVTAIFGALYDDASRARILDMMYSVFANRSVEGKSDS